MSAGGEMQQAEDDCEFCAGRAAAAQGEPRSANPYPPDGNFDDDGEPTPWYLWDVGWSTPTTALGL